METSDLLSDTNATKATPAIYCATESKAAKRQSLAGPRKVPGAALA
jgi:hypothetical protein